MARTSTRKERQREHERFGEERARARLTPETRHGIATVLLFAAAAVSLLALFQLAGTVGTAIEDLLATLLGWAKFGAPLLFAVLGYFLLFPQRYRLTAGFWLGLTLFLLATTAILSLFLPHAELLTKADAGLGGGYIGLVLSYPLLRFLGLPATVVVLVALFLIALLVMFNTTLRGLATRGQAIGRTVDQTRALFARWKERTGDEETQEASLATQPFTAKPLTKGARPPQKAGTEGQLSILPEKRNKRASAPLPLDLLEESNAKPHSGNIEGNKEKIQKTLESFGIQVEMAEVNVGPTVTQYTLKPAEGVKLAQITTLQNDLALALAAHPIRIEAPIPGQALVGIEVPNQTVAIVHLKEILRSPSFTGSPSHLTVALGKDVAGTPWVADIDPMPHLLIAGATGSGKSVMINSLIISLLYGNTSDDLKFILVDPKRVELTAYNDIPHLLTPVITDVPKTINALRWLVGEMDRRFQVLSESGKRNIQSYHREVDDGMPYIVAIIDELADLMAVAANEVEGAIIRLAQMARAVGIHLVVATQRPSVDVITGLIKANITSRIAFSVASLVDSRTILDTSGAEKLLGRGDLLYVSASLSKPKRLQGAFVSDREIGRVVDHLKERAAPEYLPDVVEKPPPNVTLSGVALAEEGLEEDDAVLAEAKQVILQAGKASASLLQRRLRLGYARAARVLDHLEEEGFIGPGEGAKPREILGRSSAATQDAPPSDRPLDGPSDGSAAAEEAAGPPDDPEPA